MEFFDTHFHYRESDFPPAEYYAVSLRASVPWLLACSSDYEDACRAAAFAEKFDKVFFAAGVHPHEASNLDVDVSEFAVFAGKSRFAAIGEIGLDFYYETSDRKSQIRVFSDFLDLSLKLNVPAIVHCRDKDSSFDAYESAYSLLKPFSEKGGRFVIHCFAGSREWAEKFGALGAMFGVGGIITFNKAQELRDIIASIPMANILLETDAPYLAPVPNRGKVNHPSMLPFTAKKLAEMKGISIEECALATTENAFRFFCIDSKQGRV